MARYSLFSSVINDAHDFLDIRRYGVALNMPSQFNVRRQVAVSIKRPDFLAVIGR